MKATERGEKLVISVDASCSGRKSACAAVLRTGEQVVAEWTCRLPEASGYVLAAEIGAVALAAKLAARHSAGAPVILEVDNPQLPGVLLEGLRPPQAHRIPRHLLAAAETFVRSDGVTMNVMPRNSTPGLRRADRLASDRLWRR